MNLLAKTFISSQKNYISILVLCGSLFSLFGLNACGLETRGGHQEQEEKKVLQHQVSGLQTVTAETKQRFEEVDEEIRKTNNRVDVLENKQEQAFSKQDKNASGREAKIRDLEERLKNYQEEIGKLNDQVSTLNQTVAAMGEAQKQMAAANASGASASASGSDATALSGSGSASTSAGSAKGKGAYEAANSLFDKKKWKEAALEYERYRKAAPKGKNVAEATYRIGVCFQEMGSTDDAKAFYQEVLERYPKTASATRSSTRLKSLGKKKSSKAATEKSEE